MKPLSNVMTKSSLVLLILVATQSSHACIFNCEAENKAIAEQKKIEEATAKADAVKSLALSTSVQASLDEQSGQQALKDLNERMTSGFADIESKLIAGKVREALTQSKSLLDQVRVITGIDPKGKIQKSYFVNETFPQDVKAITSLPQDQQERIILSLSNYQGGLFMDILNLSKRVTLLYIKSLVLDFKNHGGLFEEDRNKIVSDLLRASILPITIIDKTGIKIAATSDDIANEDHLYQFNRDLKMQILSIKELQLTEEDYTSARADYKKQTLMQKNAVVLLQKPVLIFERKDYQSCNNLYSGVGYTTAEIKTTCERAVKYSEDYGKPEFQKCYNYYVSQALNGKEQKRKNAEEALNTCRQYSLVKN